MTKTDCCLVELTVIDLSGPIVCPKCKKPLKGVFVDGKDYSVASILWGFGNKPVAAYNDRK